MESIVGRVSRKLHFILGVDEVLDVVLELFLLLHLLVFRCFLIENYLFLLRQTIYAKQPKIVLV